MPMRPPVIGGSCPSRKAWQPSSPRPDQRKRGRAGQRERAAVLAAEPLCRACLKESRTTAAVKVDHVVPLAWGGSDERGNKQALCDPCHDAKSAGERAIDAEMRRR